MISFEIDKVVIDWRPEYYLSEKPRQSFCVGVYSNGVGGNWLGGNFMRGMDVIFDRTEKRIGFAHSSCDPLFIEYLSGIPEANNTENITRESKESWIVVIGVSILVSALLIILIGLYCKRKIAKAYKPQIDLELDDGGTK